ncbi:MAG: pyridoxine 5'-phosphate synthase [Puniceicoccaceae bacterium]|nr:MAG: pyridoxine 5'-phosphate synthase [Puniceicoccaceae bacterium]
MSQPILLGVNIDHAATLRQARYREAGRTCGGLVEPDPVALALAAEHAGADGITVHLREDRRHIQEQDVCRLRDAIATRLNLEMACTEEMLQFALGLKPDSVCLVPENRREITTEGGLDVLNQGDRIGEIASLLAEAGIPVSLFIDPDPDAIEFAAELECPWIELHTGSFANTTGAAAEREFDRLREGCERGHALGLVVNAGHGINFVNIRRIRTLPFLHELNIGHSILSRALSSGIAEAVREMKRRMNDPRT